MMTSIIIPSYNGRELLQGCIESIAAYTNIPYEIIVIDDGSNDDTIEYCLRNKITFVTQKTNRGFPISCNLGMKVATGDAILLLNNDTVVSHNWLSNMLNCLYSSPDIGIVGPYTNYVSGKQQLAADYAGLEQFHEVALLRNQPNAALWLPLERLVGFCFLVKRELMERIGYLDEQYSPGHYEDDDYGYHARMVGYRLMLAGDVIIHHYGTSSFKQRDPKELSMLIHENHKKFIRKWGVDPHQFI